MKTCKGCGVAKDLSCFSPDPTGAHGVRSRCKPCRSSAETARQKAKAKKDPKEHNYGAQELPPGFAIKGISQLTDADGTVKLSWIKSDRERGNRFEDLKEALGSLIDDVDGLCPVTPTPGFSDDDLCVVYPMGDPHLGMHAWASEAGKSFDLKIATKNLFSAVDQLVELAPPAREAVIISVGDFFHSDRKGATTTAGTPVDVDTRWSKVLRAGVDTFIRLIRRALEKHEKVTAICEIGNHDEHSAIMLATVLDAFFSEEPRVTIDTSPAMFHWYRFGKCLFGVTHGNNTKVSDLPMIMACDRKQDWAETDPSSRRWYTGHVHHDSVKELHGCTVETFRTLAPSDAWHHAKGYRSARDMKCDVWHKEFGHVQRHIIGIKKIVQEG